MGGVGSGRKPRAYPAEMVARVREMYEAGFTISEIQRQVTGCKVQNLMARCGIPRRRAVPRDQSGERNAIWRGDAAGYKALHLRVATARGKPSFCGECGATEGRFEWANLTGRYEDVWDYQRMCVPCHRAYDFKGRRPNGQFVAAGEVMPHV